MCQVHGYTRGVRFSTGYCSAIKKLSPPLEKWRSRTFVICHIRRSITSYFRLEWSFVSTRTRFSKIFEILEDGVDFRSLLRFLVPTLFGDLPDCRGHSRGFKRTRLWWSFALRDHKDDSGVRNSGIGNLSGRELGVKTVRTRIYMVSGKYVLPQ